MFKKIFSSFKTHFKILLFLSLGFLVFSGMWIYGAKIKPNYILESIGSNMAFFFLGFLISIYIIDVMLNEIRDQEIKPMRKIVFSEIETFLNKFCNLWYEIYKHSVSGEQPLNTEELFSNASFEKMFTNLDVNCKPDFFIHDSWVVYIQYTISELAKYEDKFDIMAAFIDVELYSKIKEFLSPNYFFFSMNKIYDVFNMRKTQKLATRSLKDIFFININKEEYIDKNIRKINELIKCYLEEGTKLYGKNNRDFFIQLKFQNPKEEPPKCMI